MKKIMAIMCACVLTAGLLAGCGSTNQTSSSSASSGSSSVYGKIQSVDGSKITLLTGTVQEMQGGPGGGPGGNPGQGPDASGTGQPSGGPPDGKGPGGKQGDGNGSAPAAPSAPAGNSSMQPPEGAPDGKQGEKLYTFQAGSDTKTVTVSDGTKITLSDGSTGKLSDLKTGDVLKVETGSGTQASSITVLNVPSGDLPGKQPGGGGKDTSGNSSSKSK